VLRCCFSAYPIIVTCYLEQCLCGEDKMLHDPFLPSQRILRPSLAALRLPYPVSRISFLSQMRILGRPFEFAVRATRIACLYNANCVWERPQIPLSLEHQIPSPILPD
jgi:hypothetical protein